MSNNITFNPFAKNTPSETAPQSVFKMSNPSVPSFGFNNTTSQPASSGFKNLPTFQPTWGNNTNTSIFSRPTQPLDTNNAITSTTVKANDTKTHINKIKTIVEQLNANPDEKKIISLNFQLNYEIKFLSKNISETDNYLLTLYTLSKYLKSIDSNLLNDIFFLDIKTNLQEFTKIKKDWLVKNLFDTTVAIKKTLINFADTDVKCIVDNDYSNKNKIALKFFVKDLTNLQYFLGDFPTKESFLASIYFDIECLRVAKLWEQQNQAYRCNVSSRYNQDKLSDSYLYITVQQHGADNNQISVGVKTKIDHLFAVDNENILVANIVNWFNFLDKITANNHAVEHYSFDNFIKTPTINRYQNEQHKEKNNFYKTLLFALQE